MATRLDPSGTTGIARAFGRDMLSRFRAVKAAIYELIVEQDVFGLTPTPHPFVSLVGVKVTEGEKFYIKTPMLKADHFTSTTVNAEKQAWRFRSNDQKLRTFRDWLGKKVGEKVLTTDETGKPWTGKYVQSAYKKGAMRAYTDSQGKKLLKKTDFFAGTRAQFLKSAFAQPERLKKVELLSTRAFEELRGVTTSMATQMNRALANGLVQGQNPKQIAKAMSDSIDGLSKSRALTIARTEIVYAHAEGQLDSFEDLGDDEVSVLAEWSTAGDEKVCRLCSKLEGAVLTIEKARGLLPRHPNCRCAWIPYSESASRKRLQKGLDKVKASLKAVGKIKDSTWAGKELSFKLKAKEGKK